MKRKDEWQEWQERFDFLRETDTPQAPGAKPQDVKSSKRAPARTINREFRLESRRILEKDWLAPHGSERERQYLRRWSKQIGLGVIDRKLIQEWVDRPDGFEKRHWLFWESAKKAYLGTCVYGAAMERHKKLNSKEWLVAYFMLRGFRQKEIADWTKLSEREIDNVIRNIKDKIISEYRCSIHRVDLAEIARWFLGQ